MTIENFIDILVAIRDGKQVKIPYQLLRLGELNLIVDSLGKSEAVDYFQKVSESAPATFVETENV